MRASLPSILTLWWKNHAIRPLVILMTALGVLDSAFTFAWIERFGLQGEINPLARWLFASELSIAWVVANILVSFCCGAILASYCLIPRNDKRRFVASLFSCIIAARTFVDGIYLINYLGIVFLWPIISVMGIAIFVTSWQIFAHGEVGKLSALLTMLSNFWKDLTLTFASVRISMIQIVPMKNDAQTTRLNEYPSQPTLMMTGRKKRVLLWVTVIIVTPFLTLSLIQLLSILSGAQSLPRWLRSIGIVTTVQGKLFIVSFILIIVMLAVLFYAFLSIFDILTESKPKPSPIQE